MRAKSKGLRPATWSAREDPYGAVGGHLDTLLNSGFELRLRAWGELCGSVFSESHKRGLVFGVDVDED